MPTAADNKPRSARRFVDANGSVHRRPQVVSLRAAGERRRKHTAHERESCDSLRSVLCFFWKQNECGRTHITKNPQFPGYGWTQEGRKLWFWPRWMITVGDLPAGSVPPAMAFPTKPFNSHNSILAWLEEQSHFPGPSRGGSAENPPDAMAPRIGSSAL